MSTSCPVHPPPPPSLPTSRGIVVHCVRGARSFLCERLLFIISVYHPFCADERGRQCGGQVVVPVERACFYSPKPQSFFKLWAPESPPEACVHGQPDEQARGCTAVVPGGQSREAAAPRLPSWRMYLVSSSEHAWTPGIFLPRLVHWSLVST